MTAGVTSRLRERLLARPDRSATWFFLATACLIYLPPLLQGKALVGSTDNWFAIFPNHLFTAAELRRGGWGLWNPQLLGGIDFSGSTHNFLYSPASWPLFLLPRGWFKWGFHLRVAIETWLLGRFAWAFLREEFGSRPVALLAALTAQIGTNAFFAVTTYACLTLHVALYGALAAIWTIDRRALWRTFLAVWCSILIVLTTGNVVYGAGILLALGILVVYRLNPAELGRWPRNALAWIAGTAFVCALLVAMIRLLPIAGALHGGDRVFTDSFHHAFGGHMNDPLYGVTALVPEALGIQIETAKRLLQHYVWWEPVQHHQIDGHPYAGAATMLLVLLALARRRRGMRPFWPAFFVAATVWFLSVRPFADLIWTLFFPYIHAIIPRLLVPVALLGAFASALRTAIDEPGAFGDPVRVLAACALLAAGASAVPWFYLRPEAIHPVACVVLLALAAAALVFVRPSSVSSLLGRPLAVWCAVGIDAVVVGIVAWFAGWRDDLFVCSFVLIQTSIAAILLLWRSLLDASSGRERIAGRLRWLALGLVMVVMVIPLPEGAHPTLPNAALLALLGVGRLLLVTAVLVPALGALRTGRIGSEAFVVTLGLVLFADLAPANREYQHVITEPFWRPGKIDRSRGETATFDLSASDLARWRVNRPHVALGIAAEEFQGNVFTVHGIRSMGGVNSLRGERLSRLVSAFEPNPPFGPGAMTPEVNDPRLLDLLGAGFEGVSRGQVQRRPGALSRFVACSDFEVIPGDEDALRRLTDLDFDPLRRLVLDRDPPGGVAATSGRAIDLAFDELTSDRIVIPVGGVAPTIVFFGDVFDPGWHASVDGAEQAVMRADFAFMAIGIPAGARRLELWYSPPALARGKRLSGAGLLATCAALGAFAFVDSRRRQAKSRELV